MRYVKTCAECIRLGSDNAVLFQEHRDAQETLRLTPKNDRAFVEHRKEMERARGRWLEAVKRQRAHEQTHQNDEEPSN